MEKVYLVERVKFNIGEKVSASCMGLTQCKSELPFGAEVVCVKPEGDRIMYFLDQNCKACGSSRFYAHELKSSKNSK